MATLCTAYKSTVQTDQTVTKVIESGCDSNSGTLHPRDSSNQYWFVGVFVFMLNNHLNLPRAYGVLELCTMGEFFYEKEQN